MNFHESDMILAVFAATLVLLLLSSFGIIFTIIHKKKQQSNLKEKQLMKTQFEQELLQTQLEIQEQTLKNISEEIHDNVGQVLSLAKLNLNTFDHNPEKKLQSTKELVSKAINDLRNLSRSLHGDKIAETGIREAIRHELHILQNTGQYETNLMVSGEPFKLEPQQEMVLFRIVQEALHNAVKHAKASRMNVTLTYTAVSFSMTILDNGTGFDTQTLEASETGIGLKSMRNRAALIGGTLFIRSGPGNGTSILVELPTHKQVTP